MKENSRAATKQLSLSELRDQAGLTIAQAAAWLRVSTGHIWNAEHGLSRLTCEEETGLRGYYFAQIKERLVRLADGLAMRDGGDQ